MTNHEVLAANLLAAAIDGHNPRITRHSNGTTTVQPHKEGGPVSDLELLLQDLHNPRTNSQELCRELSQQAALLIVGLATHHHMEREDVISAVRQHAQDVSLAAMLPPFLDKNGNVVDKHGNLHPFNDRGDDND